VSLFARLDDISEGVSGEAGRWASFRFSCREPTGELEWVLLRLFAVVIVRGRGTKIGEVMWVVMGQS